MAVSGWSFRAWPSKSDRNVKLTWHSWQIQAHSSCGCSWNWRTRKHGVLMMIIEDFGNGTGLSLGGNHSNNGTSALQITARGQGYALLQRAMCYIMFSLGSTSDWTDEPKKRMQTLATVRLLHFGRIDTDLANGKVGAENQIFQGMVNRGRKTQRERKRLVPQTLYKRKALAKLGKEATKYAHPPASETPFCFSRFLPLPTVLHENANKLSKPSSPRIFVSSSLDPGVRPLIWTVVSALRSSSKVVGMASTPGYTLARKAWIEKWKRARCGQQLKGPGKPVKTKWRGWRKQNYISISKDIDFPGIAWTVWRVVPPKASIHQIPIILL